ncbi:MAG: outer membrane lipoprotein-sorting protein [Deltaproteobacteria bacterium RIFOXYA12_FULL_58_15]|nr:MAG: outer membrane lipoprotein-sorting protein [Deltaproteobacteria bacterium RIFOXYA12_FULL_58_15]OGR12706.1 MAG: outer membrane lipoprotein-sorting protein [Deltaproteobacteria bacterium RIFOXYB12_FULL_58_9]
MLSSLLCVLVLSAAPTTPLSEPQMVEILKTIDDRQRNSGDYTALAYIEQKERDKDDLLYEAVIYRRDDDDKLMILFTRPKAEAGKGYLRLDKNLFFYDPSVGKWERRTERERIGGTGSQRSDFDESRLAEEYNPTYVGAEKLGAFGVHQLELRAKPGADVTYPVMRLWVDEKTINILKAQELALSGKLMRTTYYPKWNTLFSEDKGKEVYFPQEIRIYDEVEKGNSTLVVMRKVDLKSLESNIFTKAWLESKSR